jgi:hypothetical protein
MMMLPAAEFARKCHLPVVAEPVAKELYGIIVPMLDERRVREMLAVCCYTRDEEAMILAVFQDRAARLG